ncbi:hypothetical protein [Mariniluteicoccus flavus]
MTTVTRETTTRADGRGARATRRLPVVGLVVTVASGVLVNGLAVAMLVVSGVGYPLETGLDLLGILVVLSSVVGWSVAGNGAARGRGLASLVVLHLALAVTAFAVLMVAHSALAGWIQLGDTIQVTLRAIVLTGGITALGACLGVLTRRTWIAPAIGIGWVASAVVRLHLDATMELRWWNTFAPELLLSQVVYTEGRGYDQGHTPQPDHVEANLVALCWVALIALVVGTVQTILARRRSATVNG